MNTRIPRSSTRSRRPVTGLDIVREQVLIAAGEPLSLAQEDVRVAGQRHRVPDQRRGRLQRLLAQSRADHGLPGARRPGVRVDSGVVAGSEASPLYDR